MSTTAEIKSKLIEKLKTISEDNDFLVGVISNAKHNEDREIIIEYIDKGEEVSYEQILLLSVWLGRERKNKK
jgi:hypothetical protein